MHRSIIAAMFAAATILAASAPASAQTYVMRDRLKAMPVKTTPAGPALLSNCTLTTNTTTQSAVNFRQVGNPTGYATLAEAKAACDAQAVGLCYVDQFTGSPYEARVASGRPFWAYAMDSGNTSPASGIAGKTVHAGYCTRR